MTTCVKRSKGENRWNSRAQFIRPFAGQITRMFSAPIKSQDLMAAGVFPTRISSARRQVSFEAIHLAAVI